MYQVSVQSGKQKSLIFQIERELIWGIYITFLKKLEDPQRRRKSYLEIRKLLSDLGCSAKGEGYI